MSHVAFDKPNVLQYFLEVRGPHRTTPFRP